MKRNILNIVILILLPILVTCDHRVDEKKNELPVPATQQSPSTTKSEIAEQPDRLNCKISDDDPYACQRVACLNAKAVYHEDNHICECKPETIFRAINGGACLDVRRLENQVFDFQFNKVRHFFVHNLKSAFKSEDLSSLVSKRSIPVFNGRLQLFLIKDPSQFFTSLEGFDWELFNLGLPNTELDYNDLNSGYSDRIIRSSLQFLMVPTGRPLVLKDADANKRLASALTSLEKQSPKANVQSFSELGCAEICIERSELLNNSSFIAYRIRVFSGGNPIQDTLNIFNKLSREVETMVVFVDHKPSHYFVSTHFGGYEVYNNDGTFIKTVSENLEVSKIKPIQSESDLAHSIPVAIFEGFYSEKVDSVAYIGPHQDYSFYGWFTESDNRPYLYGKTTTLLGEEDVGNPNHSAIVSALASANFTKRVLPMSVTSLQFDDFAKVLNRMEQQKIVANISFAFTFTPEICRKSAFASTIKSSQERVLWTIGAGNSGSELDQQSLPFCPQALEGKNILIVSATNGKINLSNASSFGENYVDVAANGCTLGEENCDNGGTSFAAPRVARIAADLIEEFPLFSIEQIKLALVCTAQVPDTGISRSPKFLTIKSGGIVDPVAARNFISLLMESSNPDLSILDFKYISVEQIDRLKIILKKARQHQFKDFTSQQIDTFLNEHIKRVINKYGIH